MNFNFHKKFLIFLILFLLFKLCFANTYKDMADSLDKESTSFYNLNERLKFAESILNLLLQEKQYEDTPLARYLSRIKKLYRWVDTFGIKSGHLGDEDLKYFDVILYNIINIWDKHSKGRDIKYYNPLLQPRLTYAFISSIKTTTYKNNIIFRSFFIHDFKMSVYFKNLSAYEKKAIEESILLNRDFMRFLKEKDTKSLFRSYKITDNALKIINSHLKFDKISLLEALFDFNGTILNEDIKVKNLQKEENISLKSTESIRKVMNNEGNNKSSFFSLKIFLFVFSISLFIILLFFIFKTLKINDSPFGNSKNIKCRTREITKTPFEEGSYNESERCNDHTLKFDVITQMLVSTLPLRYEKIWKISKGGMGIVFGAEDQFLRRKVAIKMIAPSLCDDKKIVLRFVNEARAIASLDHPNIMKIYDVGGEEYPYFVMEYLHGMSLEEIVNKKGKLSHEEIKYYGIQMADAFRYCHEKGIIHRDIKPANILVVNNFKRIKVVDFGIAKDFSTQEELTQSNVTIGSPHYMAPEQIRGRQYGLYSDIYAFGVTLYRIASGKLPFSESNILAKLTEEPYPIFQYDKSINKTLSDLIMKCIDSNPEKRFQNFDQIRTMLIKIKLSNV